MREKKETIITEIHAVIEKNIKLKIDTLTEDSTFYDWHTIYSLYQKLSSENKEKIINQIKEKIKTFNQEKLVKILLEVVENTQKLKENFDSLESFYDHQNLEDFCTFIASLNETLAKSFSEQYFNNKLSVIADNNIIEAQCIPVILTFLYLDEKNIDTRRDVLSKKLQSLSSTKIFTQAAAEINVFLIQNEKMLIKIRLYFNN